MSEPRTKYSTKQDCLNLGTTGDGDPFVLPAAAATQKIAILGKSGSGKTYAATKLAELLYGLGVQIVSLDPVGVWYGLRLDKDGKGDGLPIPVFGGEYGDIPLEPGAGALVAETIINRNISVILDVSNFRKNQRREFVTSFAEELFHRKKTARSPVMLFLEEAQFFIPQKVFKGEERLLGAFEDIGKVGRNYGIGLTMISQRPQAVNKEVLNQAEALFVLQMAAAQERKAIRDWIDAQGIDAGRAIDDIPHLQIGESYVWSPQWLKFFGKIKFSQKETYNASATPTFNTKTTIRPHLLNPEDLERLKEAMQEVVKEAQSRDPVTLRQRIIELERQLKAGHTTQIERVEVPVLKDEQINELKEIIGNLAGIGQGLVQVAQELGAALSKVVTQPAPPVAVRAPSPQPRPATPTVPAKQGDIKLRDGERRMLAVLASFHLDWLTRSQLATLAGLKASGGTFSTYLSTLRQNGFIEESGHELSITRAGLDYFGPDIPQGPRTTDELLRLWYEKLRAGEVRMIDALVGIFPGWLTRTDLAEQAGIAITGGTFGTYLSTLRQNGLIEEKGIQVRASNVLFLSREAANE